MSRTDFTDKVIKVIRAIPMGKVATYGGVAALAGNNRAARTVVWILHSSSQSEGLPWHRVINSEGKISLPCGGGRELQQEMLESEGVQFDLRGRVDLKRYQFTGV